MLEFLIESIPILKFIVEPHYNLHMHFLNIDLGVLLNDNLFLAKFNLLRKSVILSVFTYLNEGPFNQQPLIFLKTF